MNILLLNISTHNTLVVGGLIFGVLTDKFGRKPTYFVANILMSGAGVLAALAPEYIRLEVSRA